MGPSQNRMIERRFCPKTRGWRCMWAPETCRQRQQLAMGTSYRRQDKST